MELQTEHVVQPLTCARTRRWGFIGDGSEAGGNKVVETTFIMMV